MATGWNGAFAAFSLVSSHFFSNWARFSTACRLNLHLTVRCGIEGFSARSLVEQNNVALTVVDNSFDPRVTWIVRRGLFEVLWYMANL
jgi:hypothetical protein